MKEQKNLICSCIRCCPEYDRFPPNLKRFIPELCKEFKRLECRHRKAFTKRKYILNLAQPRHYYPRFVPKCACKFTNPVEIIRPDERQHTRTVQLSYPSVRKLLLFKERVKNLYPKERMLIINRMIRNSLMSLYSRLQNVQPPEQKVPIHKWDKKEWNKHMKHIKNLAKHKVAPREPKLPVNRKSLNEMRRFRKLAKPIKREVLEKENWVLTHEMRFYQPSECILRLAKPIMRDEDALYQPLPLQIPPNALKYKASARIKELSTPPEKRVGELDVKENPFGISPNALKAKASARVQELAEPKEAEAAADRELPIPISPAALKAKASPRICELAKPKGAAA